MQLCGTLKANVPSFVHAFATSSRASSADKTRPVPNSTCTCLQKQGRGALEAVPASLKLASLCLSDSSPIDEILK